MEVGDRDAECPRNLFIFTVTHRTAVRYPIDLVARDTGLAGKVCPGDAPLGYEGMERLGTALAVFSRIDAHRRDFATQDLRKPTEHLREALALRPSNARSMPRTIDDAAFYHGDCVEQAREHIPDASVDLIITDPPYGIGGDVLHQHYNRDESFVVDGYVEVPTAEYGKFSALWIAEADRVLRPGGSIYVVSGYTNLYDVLHGLKQTNLQEINHIVWKYNFGVYTSRKYVSSHYHILYYGKPGDRRTFNLESRYGKAESGGKSGSPNYRDREDVWIINREYKPGQRKNKNELPAALLLKMLQYSSNEGDLVLDFFMGGGSTGRIARGLNRRFIGLELSDLAFEHASESVRAMKPGSLLGSLKKPELSAPRENEGAPWRDDDYAKLLSMYRDLRKRGMQKNATVAKLCDTFGRGYWSIEKALKRLGETDAQTREIDLSSTANR